MARILCTKHTIPSPTKVQIFKDILRETKSNHDLGNIEEGVFASLPKRFRPEKQEQLKGIVRLFFQDL